MITSKAYCRQLAFFNSIPEEFRSTTTWPNVDKSTVRPNDLERFERLSKACATFVDRKEFVKAIEEAEICERQFLELMRKALIPRFDGHAINGMRAFVKHLVQRKRKRWQPIVEGKSDTAGYGGAFEQLLRERGNIQPRLIAYLNGVERPNQIRPAVLLAKFKLICEEEGVPLTRYPLASDTQGAQPLQAWYENVYIPTHLTRHLRKQHGPAAAVAVGYELGKGDAKITPTHFGTWTFDEYTVDLDAVIEVPSERWGVQLVPVRRFHILLCRNTGPMACNVSWHMTLRRQASGADAIRLLRNAVLGQPAAHVVEPSIKCIDGAGYPTSKIPALKYAVPNVIELDNALSHLYNPLNTVVLRLFGGRVLLGPPGKPKARPQIESALGKIARSLIHQLPSTTGTGPTDPARKKSKVDPSKRVPIALLEQGIDTFFSNQNVLPSAAAGYQDSFSLLHRLSDSGLLKVNKLHEKRRAPRNFCEPTPVTIRSNHAKGRGPHVNFLHRRYSAEWLKPQVALNNTVFRALADDDDLRTIELIDDRGSTFGLLTVEGFWAKFPHDRRTVEIFGKYKNKARFAEGPAINPLFGVLRYLAKAAPTNPVTALDYGHLLTYLGRHINPGTLEEALGAGAPGEAVVNAKTDAANSPVARPRPPMVIRQFNVPRSF